MSSKWRGHDSEPDEARAEFWSESESFNTRRDAGMRPGPERPAVEAEFPNPGVNTSALGETPYGGLREPLWLADGWRDPDDAHLSWTESLDGFYPGFPGFLTGEDRARWAYGDTLDRLAEIKSRYDPENRRHTNLNVTPAT